MTESKKWMILGGVLLLSLLLYLLTPILTPFLTAAVLAYLTDPIVNQLQRLKIPRILAVTIVFILLALIVFVALFFLIPLLEQQIVLVFKKVPDVINWFNTVFIPWLSDHFHIQTVFNIEAVQKTLTSNWQSAGVVATSVVTTVTKSGMAIIAWATNLILIPVVLFYLLRDWNGFLLGVQQLLPRRIEPTATKLFLECDEVLSAFLRGQLMVMLGLGFLYTLGLWIVGLDLALLIGLVAGLVSIVPYLGFIVGFGAAAVAAYFQFHDYAHIGYILIAFVIAQSIEGMILTPLFVGDKIRLHPVAVIFAILAGGQLFGFVGILLALPVAAVTMVFVRYFRSRYIDSQLYRKEEPTTVVITEPGGEGG